MRRRTKLIRYNKGHYHPNFFQRGPACLKRANYTCEHCGVKRGQEQPTRKGRKDMAVIQAAHVNHDPSNPKAKLIALCKQCHLRYDALVHGKKAAQTRMRKKREQQKDDGQLELSIQVKQKTGRPRKQIIEST